MSKNISRTITYKEITFGKTLTNTHKTLVRISLLRTQTYQKINLRAQKRQPRTRIMLFQDIFRKEYSCRLSILRRHFGEQGHMNGLRLLHKQKVRNYFWWINIVNDIELQISFTEIIFLKDISKCLKWFLETCREDNYYPILLYNFASSTDTKLLISFPRNMSSVENNAIASLSPWPKLASALAMASFNLTGSDSYLNPPFILLSTNCLKDANSSTSFIAGALR